MSDLLTRFREDFPEFSDVSDSEVERWLETAREIHSLSETATLHLAAHLLALSQEDSGGVDDGAGVVTAESIGPKSVSYRTQAESGQDVFFERTRYGRTFLVLERRATAFSARVF